MAKKRVIKVYHSNSNQMSKKKIPNHLLYGILGGIFLVVAILLGILLANLLVGGKAVIPSDSTNITDSTAVSSDTSQIQDEIPADKHRP